MKTVIALVIMSIAAGAAGGVLFGCCSGKVCRIRQAPGVVFEGHSEIATCIYSAERRDLICLTPEDAALMLERIKKQDEK